MPLGLALITGLGHNVAASGGGGGGSTATWNPADKDSGITLSGGNLIADVAASDWHNVRATISKTSGKWYFEVAISSVGSNTGIGLANGTASLANYLGVDANSIGWFSTQFTSVEGTVLGGLPLFTGGDVVGYAFDMTAGKVYFAKNNAWSVPGGGTSDPAAGTSGTAMTLTTIFPAFGGNGGQGTIKLLGTLTYTPPTGFTALS